MHRIILLLLSSCVSIKTEDKNNYDKNELKTGLWTEKTDNELIVGYYLFGKKSGTWTFYEE